MSDKAQEALRTAVEETYAEWVAEHNMSPGVVRDWILVAAAIGFNNDGDDVEQIMIVPSGPAYALQGLLAEADARFRFETFIDLGDTDD